jgi:hypothetical protein
LFIDKKSYAARSKESIFSNFVEHGDKNAENAFSSLLNDGLILKTPCEGGVIYCLNVFEKLVEIECETLGNKSKVMIDIDQPLEKEFNDVDHAFTTEADRAYPNRGKYYHCTKKTDKTYWITLMKPKGNARSKRLVLGSLSDSESRISRIYNAIIVISKGNRNGIIIKKHVEDIEPKACGNTRQYSKASFDVLEYLKKIQAVGSKGRTVKYLLLNEKRQEQKYVQLTLDNIFEEVKITTP